MSRSQPLIAAAALAAAVSTVTPANAQLFSLFEPSYAPAPYERTMRVAPPADIEAEDEGVSAPAQVPAAYRRQVVSYATREPAGTIVIDTANTYLYYVLGGGRAVRYGIGVGREGFTWSGVKAIARKSEWPDWHPPQEMIERQPYLPRFMAGGPGNPLGARAMYLGGSLYRIHGTNDPSSIGKRVSSGCIRLLNQDVVDLYERAGVGTRVVVLPGSAARSRDHEVRRPSRGVNFSASRNGARVN